MTIDVLLNKIRNTADRIWQTEMVRDAALGWAVVLPWMALVYVWPVLLLYTLGIGFLTVLAIIIGFALRTAVVSIGSKEDKSA